MYFREQPWQIKHCRVAIYMDTNASSYTALSIVGGKRVTEAQGVGASEIYVIPNPLCGGAPRFRLNVKMPSCLYMDSYLLSYYKDKTVSRPSYLYKTIIGIMGIPLPGNTVFILGRIPDRRLLHSGERARMGFFFMLIILISRIEGSRQNGGKCVCPGDWELTSLW